MKNRFKILLVILLMFPIIIYGKTYSEGVDIAKNLIKNYPTYDEFLLTGNQPYGFQNGNNVLLPEFENGGFLNIDEYIISLPITKNTSYLSIGEEFFVTEENYGIAGSTANTVYRGEHIKGLDVGVTDASVRVTEFARPDSQVTGAGTLDDPWIFVSTYSLKLEYESSKVKELYLNIQDNDHKLDLTKAKCDSKGVCVIEAGTYMQSCVGAGCGVNIIMVPEETFMYTSNNCGGIPTSNGSIRIENLIRDTKCTLKFGTGRYKITIGEDRNGFDKDTKPEHVYLKYGENYYETNEFTKVITELETKPNIPGYKFKGYTYNDSKTIIDEDGKFVDKTSIKTDTTLKIALEAEEYKISFDANGSTDYPAVDVSQVLTVRYGQPYGNLPTTTRVGHSFAGWYTSASGGTKITSDKIVQETTNRTLYAHWSPCPAGTFAYAGMTTCTKCIQGSTSEEKASLCIPCQPSGEEGVNGTTSADGATTCNASCNKSHVSSWTLTTWNSSNYVSYPCTITACKTGYTLSSNTCAVTNYTITYTLGGGSVSGNPSTYNINTATFTLKNPTRTGYTFKGWTGSNGTTPSTSVSIGKGSTGNKSYTANWDKVNYSITYTLNGGSLASGVTNPSSYNVETTTFTLKNPSRAGYTFKGWTGSNGTTPSTSVSIAKGSTGNKTYTANWEKVTYTITYNLDGGSLASGVTNPTSYNVETTTFTLNNPSKTSYAFKGWTGSNGSTPSTSVSIAKGSTGNKTYTANWDLLKYTVTFNVNGGNAWTSSTCGSGFTFSSSTCKKDVIYGQTYGTLPTPLRNGYEFQGWYKETGFTNLVKSTTTVSTKSNHTLYAKWKVCAAGTYWVSGTCKTCEAGYYCGGGVNGKVACPIGTYSTTSGATSSSTCTSCGSCKTTATAASTSASACTWNYGDGSRNSTSQGYKDKIGVAVGNTCHTDIFSWWGTALYYKASGNYGFEDWFSDNNHGYCSSNSLHTYAMQRYWITASGSDAFGMCTKSTGQCNNFGDICKQAPLYGNISTSINKVAMSSGNKSYTFSSSISGEKTVYFQIRNGGGAGTGIKVSGVKFNINGSYYTLKQMVENGYVKKLVLAGGNNFDGTTGLKMYDGGDMTGGAWPDSFAVFMLNSGYTLKGFQAYQSINSKTNYGDGYFVRATDTSNFRMVLK